MHPESGQRRSLLPQRDAGTVDDDAQALAGDTRRQTGKGAPWAFYVRAPRFSVTLRGNSPEVRNTSKSLRVRRLAGLWPPPAKNQR